MEGREIGEEYASRVTDMRNLHKSLVRKYERSLAHRRLRRE
jgi:hypothetical protein